MVSGVERDKGYPPRQSVREPVRNGFSSVLDALGRSSERSCLMFFYEAESLAADIDDNRLCWIRSCLAIVGTPASHNDLSPGSHFDGSEST